MRIFHRTAQRLPLKSTIHRSATQTPTFGCTTRLAAVESVFQQSRGRQEDLAGHPTKSTWCSAPTGEVISPYTKKPPMDLEMKSCCMSRRFKSTARAGHPTASH